MIYFLELEEAKTQSYIRSLCLYLMKLMGADCLRKQTLVLRKDPF